MRSSVLWLLALVLVASTGSTGVQAAEVMYEVRTGMTVPQMRAYVDRIEKRIRFGQYERVQLERLQAVDQSIAPVRSALDREAGAKQPSPELDSLMGRFIGLVLEAEEGGIVCKRVKETGTHRVRSICYTQRELDEQRELVKRKGHHIDKKNVRTDSGG